MNKLFLFALVALIAVCAAAPAEDIGVLSPIEGGVATHETDKRAAVIRTLPGYGYRYYPSGPYDYNYRYYPSAASAYDYPYYGRYII